MAIDSLVMSMCLITWTLPAAGPADWPEFRGAGGAGVAPGKLVVVGGKLADPAWFVPVAGQGWSEHDGAGCFWRIRIFWEIHVQFPRHRESFNEPGCRDHR